MQAGAPFEVIEDTAGGQAVRVFRNAPPTLSDAIDQGRAHGDLEFIVSGQTRLSFNEFFERADRLADWLREQAKIQPGQSIALCMKNAPEWMIAFVAIAKIGAVAVLVNSRGTGEAMAAAVADADCVFVIADAPRLALLRDGGCALPALVVRDDPDQSLGAAAGGNATLFNAAINSTPINAKQTSAPRQSNDLAAMFFTSGTTGRAKAAAISNRALVTGVMNTQLAMAAIYLGLAQQYGVTPEALKAQMPQSSSLLVFPLFHTSGCMAVFLTSLISGGKLVLMDRWDADEALSLVEQERITSIGGVPTMYWDILNADSLDSRDLSSLMALSFGGQALPLGLLHALRERFPNVYIGAGYGMTETSGSVSQANGAAFLKYPDASGQILPMVDVQITGEDGKPVPHGQSGEIWVRGATLMDGYYKNPEATEAAMRGGWFKTGDIGRLGPENYIYIVDRKTDMVISGGENIYCAEIEQVLGQHKAIREIVTFGVPDERLGERLVAQVLVRDPTFSQEDFLDYARSVLGAYQIPTDVVITQTPFAHNAMGKVQKAQVREAYLRTLED